MKFAGLRIPTRRTVLTVRCSLALVALVTSLLHKDIITPVIIGFQIWRWKEEWQQPVQLQREIERRESYIAELRKWRGLMMINAAVSAICFLIIVARGAQINAAANVLASAAVIGYWYFDRARLLIWVACFFSIVALVVTIFGPFEINFR